MNDVSRFRRQLAADDSAFSGSSTCIASPAVREENPHPTRERLLRLEHEQSHRDGRGAWFCGKDCPAFDL